MSARSRDGMMKDSKAKTSHAKTSVKVAKGNVMCCGIVSFAIRFLAITCSFFICLTFITVMQAKNYT